MMNNGMNGVMVIGGDNVADLEKGLEMLKRMVEGGCPSRNSYDDENGYNYDEDDDDYGYDYDDDCYGNYDDDDEDDDEGYWD